MNEPGATADGLKLAFTFLADRARHRRSSTTATRSRMPGGGDPDNRRDFPGGWPGDPRNAFDAAGRTADEQSTFDHLRRLLHLRAELPALRRGTMMNLSVADQTWAYVRRLERTSVVVLLNNGSEPASFDCSAVEAGLADGQTLGDRLAGIADARVEGGRLKAAVGPRSAAILAPR